MYMEQMGQSIIDVQRVDAAPPMLGTDDALRGPQFIPSANVTPIRDRHAG